MEAHLYVFIVTYAEDILIIKSQVTNASATINMLDRYVGLDFTTRFGIWHHFYITTEHIRYATSYRLVLFDNLLTIASLPYGLKWHT